MVCTVCGVTLSCQRSTRRYCSNTCRQRAHRARHRVRCHQRKIRDAEMKRDPRPVMTSFEGCTVEQIPTADALPIILRYEWLRSVGRPQAAYGLLTPRGLAGVTLFGLPGSDQSRWLCGPENADRAICLERGACTHWAHPHAASFLISRACKLAAREHGWRVVYAYSDPAAGELGTVYQACNWLYLGQGIGRGGRLRSVVIDPDGNEFTPRTLRRRGVRVSEVANWEGWKVEKREPKHTYVWLAEKRLRGALRHEPQPYPSVY